MVRREIIHFFKGPQFFTNQCQPKAVKILNYHAIGMNYVFCLLSKMLIEGRKIQGWNPYGKCNVNLLPDHWLPHTPQPSPTETLIRETPEHSELTQAWLPGRFHVGISAPPLP